VKRFYFDTLIVKTAILRPSRSLPVGVELSRIPMGRTLLVFSEFPQDTPIVLNVHLERRIPFLLNTSPQDKRRTLFETLQPSYGSTFPAPAPRMENQGFASIESNASNLCGLGHAFMTGRLIRHAPNGFYKLLQFEWTVTW